MIRSKIVFGFVVLVTWGSANWAIAGGLYHMPTSALQHMGWGFGPGYHAPLLLGPPHCGPIRPQRVIRLPAAPHGVGVGCGGCDGCDAHGLSQLSEYPISPVISDQSDYCPPQTSIEQFPLVEQPESNITPIENPLFGPPPQSSFGR